MARCTGRQREGDRELRPEEDDLARESEPQIGERAQLHPARRLVLGGGGRLRVARRAGSDRRRDHSGLALLGHRRRRLGRRRRLRLGQGEQRQGEGCQLVGGAHVANDRRRPRRTLDREDPPALRADSHPHLPTPAAPRLPRLGGLGDDLLHRATKRLGRLRGRRVDERPRARTGRRLGRARERQGERNRAGCDARQHAHPLLPGSPRFLRLSDHFSSSPAF